MSPIGASIFDRAEAESDGAGREENVPVTTTATVTTTSVTTSTVTTPSGAPKRSYVRRSTALGQFYMNRTEQEESALDKFPLHAKRLRNRKRSYKQFC